MVAGTICPESSMRGVHAMLSSHRRILKRTYGNGSRRRGSLELSGGTVR